MVGLDEWTSDSTLTRDTSLSIARASRTLTLPSVAASPYLPSVDVRRSIVVALVVGILGAPLVGGGSAGAETGSNRLPVDGCSV